MRFTAAKITLAQVKFEDSTAKLTIDFNLSCKSLFSFSKGFIFIDNYVHVLSLCFFVQIENGNATQCSEVNGVTVCGEYNLSEEFFSECSDPASEYL